MIITVTPNANTLFPIQPSGVPFVSYPLSGINPVTNQIDPFTYPHGFKLGRKQEIQSFGYFRGLQGGYYDRGNVEFSLNFTVRRVFKSLTQSETWNAIHLASVPTSGLVKIVLDQDAGLYGQLFFYSLDWNGNFIGATVQVEAQEFIGVTTIHNYVIQCGKISTISPI